MPSWKFSILVLCCVTMVITPSGETSAPRSEPPKITCSAGRFELGQTATVTCFFHKDVGATKTAFDMTVKYFDASGNTDSSIVNCNWFDNGTLHCLIKDGFVLRNKDNLKNNLTVDIPTFTGNHTGIYKCHVIDDETPTEPCYLLNTLVYPSPQSASSDTVGYIVGLIFLAVALVGVIVAWLITNRRKQNKGQTYGVPLPDSKPMLQAVEEDNKQIPQAAQEGSSQVRQNATSSTTDNHEVERSADDSGDEIDIELKYKKKYPNTNSPTKSPTSSYSPTKKPHTDLYLGHK